MPPPEGTEQYTTSVAANITADDAEKTAAEGHAALFTESRFPSATTCGTCHHVSPVAQMAAASVRTTGVPSAAMAP